MLLAFLQVLAAVKDHRKQDNKLEQNDPNRGKLLEIK